MAPPIVSGILRFLAVRPKIGELILNCTVSEVHGAEYVLSDSPIENGSVLTDHKIRMPRVLQIEAIISPYPDNIVDQLPTTTGAFGGMNAYKNYQTFWSRLRAQADSNETFEVITSLEVYKSMVFQSFSHTEQNEGIIRLSAILREIQFNATRKDAFVKENVAGWLEDSDSIGLQGLELVNAPEIPAA